MFFDKTLFWDWLLDWGLLLFSEDFLNFLDFILNRTSLLLDFLGNLEYIEVLKWFI